MKFIKSDDLLGKLWTFCIVFLAAGLWFDFRLNLVLYFNIRKTCLNYSHQTTEQKNIPICLKSISSKIYTSTKHALSYFNPYFELCFSCATEANLWQTLKNFFPYNRGSDLF